MSQFQPLYAPVYGSSPGAKAPCAPGLAGNVRRDETDVIETAGRVKFARKFSTGPRMSLTRRSTRSKRVILNDSHIVNKDFIGIFDEMENQLSQCELSTDDEKLREDFREDLKGIRELIVKVLAAHRQVAHTIRDVFGTPPRRGCVPDVWPRLIPAWQSIRAVTAQLHLVSERLAPRNEQRKAGIASEDETFRALFGLLADMEIPRPMWGADIGLGLGSPIWSGVHTNAEEFKLLSTKIIQCLSNIGAMARFQGFVDHSGFDAPVYKHDVFKATGDCLVSVQNLTKQLGQILGSLEHSWNRKHKEDHYTLRDNYEPPMEGKLIEIADLLDNHVEDCMVMASNIQRNFNVQKKLLSPVELYEEHKWHTCGAEALRSCPKRAATFTNYVEQRVSKVQKLLRGMTFSQ